MRQIGGTCLRDFQGRRLAADCSEILLCISEATHYHISEVCGFEVYHNLFNYIDLFLSLHCDNSGSLQKTSRRRAQLHMAVKQVFQRATL